MNSHCVSSSSLSSDEKNAFFTRRAVFLSAVQRGDCSQIISLLQSARDFNVNLIDGQGQTPLHQCCMNGNLELVKILVRHGADVRLANRDGWSPLHIASFCGNYHIVMYLVGNANADSPYSDS
jgi:ankyrin repeat protein